MHEYNLTPHSLYAAVSVGLETENIITALNNLSKTKLPKEVTEFIHASTANYGKVKLVLNKNRYFIESPFPEVRTPFIYENRIMTHVNFNLNILRRSASCFVLYRFCGFHRC